MGVRTTILVPGDDDLPYLEVETLRAGALSKGVLTCHSLYECFTHFIGRRTLPCLDGKCAGCEAHRPARYEAFASVIWLHNRRHKIVRLTKNCVFMLKTQAAGRSSLRGSVVEFERKTARANGRLCANLLEQSVESSRLPEAPELAMHLARIWRVDGMEVETDLLGYVAQYQAFVGQIEAKKGGDDGSET